MTLSLPRTPGITPQEPCCRPRPRPRPRLPAIAILPSDLSSGSFSCFQHTGFEDKLLTDGELTGVARFTRHWCVGGGERCSSGRRRTCLQTALNALIVEHQNTNAAMQMDPCPRLQIAANCNILENCRPDRCCVVLSIFIYLFIYLLITHQSGAPSSALSAALVAVRWRHVGYYVHPRTDMAAETLS